MEDASQKAKGTGPAGTAGQAGPAEGEAPAVGSLEARRAVAERRAQLAAARAREEEKAAAAAPKPAAAPQPQPQPKPKPEAAGPAPIVVRPAATTAKPKKRHYMLALSFVLLVLAPLAVAAWYLYRVADDQYASRVGFSVRKEEVGSAIELLGGITELSGSSSSDTDILYEFIQSEQMVHAINERLDLSAIYANPGDPIFGLGEDTRIEAMANYWGRMVKVFYDAGTGLIEVRVLSFDPDNSHDIAAAIFEESSAMINELSAIARADATRYAKEELDRAQDRLKEARQAITGFRNRTRIVDPRADIQGQMGLITSLQAKLADAIIERQLLLETSSESDPRVIQANRRIEVIREQIEEERAQFGTSATGNDDKAFSRLLEEYEALSVDLEFAEQASISARTAYEAALTEAQRQSRYLAAYIAPTRAQTPEYPRRSIILLMGGAFLAISWAILALIYYSLRDRR